MPGMTSTLIASITAIDPNSAQPITRNIGNPSLAGQFASLQTYELLANAGVDIDIRLSAIPIYLCVYVKNLNAPGGGTLTVKGTPQGGVLSILAVLPPGGVFIYWAPATGATLGYSLIYLNPSANSTPVEYYLGG